MLKPSYRCKPRSVNSALEANFPPMCCFIFPHFFLRFTSCFISCFTSLISSNHFPLILLGPFSSFQSLFALSPFPNSDSIEQVKPFRTLILLKNQPIFQNLSLSLTCIPAFGSQCTWRGKVSCLLLSPSNAR